MCGDPVSGCGALLAIATAWGVGRTWWVNARKRRTERRRNGTKHPLGQASAPPPVPTHYRRDVVKWRP
jgi:hypothetical protein